MHDGTIYDTDTQLSWLKDVGAGGHRSWYKAVAWADSLNTGKGFAGLTGWRLPKADTACGSNYNCINSELGLLFYTELKNAGGGLTHTAPFTNLLAESYWSDTNYPSKLPVAWDFAFFDGYQTVGEKSEDDICAWAVCPGTRTY